MVIKSDAAILVADLEKSFKNIEVLKKVEFSVRKGSIFALLGPNGTGKTTIIKILTTLMKPDKGNALIYGYDVVKEPKLVREKISLTGQYTAVDDVLTGRENLRMVAKLYHIQNADESAEELLIKFNLLEAADRQVAAYSGGMRRRLDLAMSMIGNPSVIFLDEPTTGLDPQSRIAMWKIIKDLSMRGITVLLTTQYLEEAEQLADQIAILNQGVIVAQGTAQDLKKLLPNKHIELRFFNDSDLESAQKILDQYSIMVDKNNLALLIVSNGSIKQISQILNMLEKLDVPIAQITQKLPTLEDVFFAIINKNNRKEDTN